LHIACFDFCTAHDLLLLLYLKLGGGGNAGVNEPLTQPPPAKPTWAQILNSNPNPPSNTSTTTGNNNNNNNSAAIAANNSPSSSSPSSQHSATTKTISPSASGTLNITGSRPGFMPNFYDQQQWPLNFNQTSSWMINDDDSQRQPTNPSQQSIDNSGDGTSVLYCLICLKKKNDFFFLNFS